MDRPRIARLALPSPLPAAAAGALLAASLAGCVRREIDISSDPQGALVTVNDREVGRTPCRVEFDHYGLYDVRLTLDGYESVVGMGEVDAPVWDWAGVDLVTELAPLNLRSSHAWHFTLIPATDDPEALARRARALQSDLLTVEASSPARPATAPPPPPPETERERARRKSQIPVPDSVLPPSEPPPEAPGSGG